MKDALQQQLQEIVKELTGKDIKVLVSIPKDSSKGDFSTNVAFQLSSSGKGEGERGKWASPFELAQDIASKFNRHSGESRKGRDDARIKDFSDSGQARMTESFAIAVAVAPGFINFTLSQEALTKHLKEVLDNPNQQVLSKKMERKKLMVEFAHPNTHKEMHIGHMRTLITGEALSRLLQSQGAEVFRANYQGDIGPHVAKAIYGIEKIMAEKGLSMDDVEEWSYPDKAHFLGEGYARGSKDYEEAKEEIDEINNKLYRKESGHYWDVYQITRRWSLDYYDEFYTRFYTKFDRLFLESEMYEKGKQIVEENVGKIFTKDEDGSIIFKGEPYGLHTRVFVTKAGNPTYEGKEIQNAFTEWETFHFDKKIHVVASEQAGYFQVVFKALELLDPEKFKDKQYHLSMGMVQLVGRKMSSRTGDVMTVDWLIDQVKGAAEELFKEGKLVGEERDIVLEQVAIGAVKYSVLKGGTAQNTVFDIEKSVSLDGNSGPYIQYSYARTQSVLQKADIVILNDSEGSHSRDSSALPQNDTHNSSLITHNSEELLLLRKLYQFVFIVEDAATSYSPNVLTEYLFELSQLFNNFYQKYRILNAATKKEKEFRLALTAGVGVVLKQGLNLLGIQAPERM